jgi:hypothetical protein
MTIANKAKIRYPRKKNTYTVYVIITWANTNIPKEIRMYMFFASNPNLYDNFQLKKGITYTTEFEY